MRLPSILLVLLAATTAQATPPRRFAVRQDPSGQSADGAAAPAETPEAPAGTSPTVSAPAPETPSESPVIPNPQPVDDTPTSTIPSDPSSVVDQPGTASASVSAISSWPCRSECNDPGEGNFPNACKDKTSQACLTECQTSTIKTCMDCVNANAGNPIVEERYREHIDNLWGVYQGYCDAVTTTSKFGKCAICEHIIAELSSLSNCDTEESCAPGCSEHSQKELGECKACADTDQLMTDEGRAEVATLLDNWGPKWCPAANTTDCGLECEAIGVAMNESCTDGKVACHGLCPNYGAAESCWNCQNKIDKRYDNPQNALGFYCTDSCGAECGWVGDTYAQRCMGLADPKECVLCNGADARPTLDRCNKCVPGSRLYPEQKATVMASLAQVYAMCQETKVPVGCEKECKILETYTELCEGLDPQKCAGMCKDPNPQAMELCNTCAHSNESVYSVDTRALIQENVVYVAKWCVVVINTTTQEPPTSVGPPKGSVSVQVPNPRGVKDVVDKENKNPPPRNTTSPLPNQNPFGNTTAPVNAKNSSSGGGGIPTWGIGVAVGGSVLVVAGAAAAIVANNFECDHDHRRLRRKKKNKKKKNNNNMPAPEWHQEPEKPQVVGYMLPTQGYDPVPTQMPPTAQYPQQYAQAPYGQSTSYSQSGRY